jgi:hypothetical protein
MLSIDQSKRIKMLSIDQSKRIKIPSPSFFLSTGSFLHFDRFAAVHHTINIHTRAQSSKRLPAEVATIGLSVAGLATASAAAVQPRWETYNELVCGWQV